MSSNFDRKHPISISVLSNFTNSRLPEEYKINAATTAGDLVREVLSRHNMLSKDPHLLYVTLDALGPRAFVAESVELKEDSRLIQRLQLAQRTRVAGQDSNTRPVFVLHRRSGGLLKIHDSCIMPGSFYNSLYVSTETTASQAIVLLLASYGSSESADNFCLVAKDVKGREVRLLSASECPLVVQQQQQSGREHLSIHLRRANNAHSGSPRKQQQQQQQQQNSSPPEPPPSARSRSDTLARLRESFRDLQRLREQNPDLYDKMLVTGSGEGDQSAGAALSSSSKQRHPATIGRGSHQHRNSARLLGGATQRQHRGSLSARTGAAKAHVMTSSWMAGNEELRRDESLTDRQEEHPQQPSQAKQQQQQQQQAKRQLPQLPVSSMETRARQLKLELEAQRHFNDQRNEHQSQHQSQHQNPNQRQHQHQTPHQQQHQRHLQTQQHRHQPSANNHQHQHQLLNQHQHQLVHQMQESTLLQPTKRDFQCQAFEEAGLLGRTRSPHNQPSLREILVLTNACSCQLTRSSRSQAWGIRFQEVQFGDVNGNHQHNHHGESGPPPDSNLSIVGGISYSKPAIGKRQGSVFQRRNERLLKYMQTLVAVISIDSTGAAALASLDQQLHPGDLILELNGSIATGMSLDEIKELVESQVTLDLLVARQPSRIASLATSLSNGNGDLDVPSSTFEPESKSMQQQLKQLKLHCNELDFQNRVNEEVIQRLRDQLARKARVCLLQQHTEFNFSDPNASSGRPRSRGDSAKSFQVIRDTDGEDSPIDSAV